MDGPADFGNLEEARTLRERLREKFPPEQVGKLPATSKRPALDYVGHAAVTDRLNRYAPDWTYTVDKLFNSGDSTWIEGTITVGGVSRVEYGEGKTPKEAISDFVKRGAMRFGVAIDLWSKEELDDSSSVGAVVSAASAESSQQPEAHTGEKPKNDHSTAAETSEGGGRVENDRRMGKAGSAPKAPPSDAVPSASVETSPEAEGISQETHVHGDWTDAPRAGWVICGRERNGRACGFAERKTVVKA